MRGCGRVEMGKGGSYGLVGQGFGGGGSLRVGFPGPHMAGQLKVHGIAKVEALRCVVRDYISMLALAGGLGGAMSKARGDVLGCGRGRLWSAHTNKREILLSESPRLSYSSVCMVAPCFCQSCRVESRRSISTTGPPQCDQGMPVPSVTSFCRLHLVLEQTRCLRAFQAES